MCEVQAGCVGDGDGSGLGIEAFGTARGGGPGGGVVIGERVGVDGDVVVEVDEVAYVLEDVVAYQNGLARAGVRDFGGVLRRCWVLVESYKQRMRCRAWGSMVVLLC